MLYQAELRRHLSLSRIFAVFKHRDASPSSRSARTGSPPTWMGARRERLWLIGAVGVSGATTKNDPAWPGAHLGMEPTGALESIFVLEYLMV
jgi:hypothetical protein